MAFSYKPGVVVVFVGPGRREAFEMKAARLLRQRPVPVRLRFEPRRLRRLGDIGHNGAVNMD